MNLNLKNQSNINYLLKKHIANNESSKFQNIIKDLNNINNNDNNDNYDIESNDNEFIINKNNNHLIISELLNDFPKSNLKNDLENDLEKNIIINSLVNLNKELEEKILILETQLKFVELQFKSSDLSLDIINEITENN